MPPCPLCAAQQNRIAPAGLLPQASQHARCLGSVLPPATVAKPVALLMQAAAGLCQEVASWPAVLDEHARCHAVMLSLGAQVRC